MLAQLKAELECFKRKINNLEEAISTKNLNEIEIEFSNVKSNLECIENEILAADEELGAVDETIYDKNLNGSIFIEMEFKNDNIKICSSCIR